MREGWRCPECRTVWAPDVERCETCVSRIERVQSHGGDTIVVNVSDEPTRPNPTRSVEQVPMLPRWRRG